MTTQDQYDSLLHAAVRMAMHRGERELAALLLQSEIIDVPGQSMDGPYLMVSVRLGTPVEMLDLIRPYVVEPKVDHGVGPSPLADLFRQFWPDDEWVSQVTIEGRLEPLESNWREQLTAALDAGPSNQGRPFGTSPVITHNGLNYRSKSEVAIAKTLELSDDIMFLPNCTTVSGKVPKEPDFLIFFKGRAGVLEVDGPHHTGRLADDTLRDSVFQRQGLFVKHYPAERCWSDPAAVIKDFLGLLIKAR